MMQLMLTLKMTLGILGLNEWECVLVDAAIEVTGTLTMREYVRRRQAKTEKYFAGKLISKLYTGAERMEGYITFLRQWDQ